MTEETRATNTAVDLSKIENSKENIQPLSRSSGKRVHALADRLQQSESESDRKTSEERRAWEKALTRDKSDDPLALWHKYIRWIKHSYPSGDNQKAQLLPTLERCVRKFQDWPQYKESKKYLRIWVEYANLCSDAESIFNFLRQRDIGQKHAFFWRCWAVVAEGNRDFDKVATIYDEARKVGAEPVADLDRSYQQFCCRLRARIQNQDASELYQSIKSESMSGDRNALHSIGDGSQSYRDGQTIPTAIGNQSKDPRKRDGKLTVQNGNESNIPFQVFSDDANGKPPQHTGLAYRNDPQTGGLPPINPNASHELGSHTNRIKENSGVPTQWTGQGFGENDNNAVSQSINDMASLSLAESRRARQRLIVGAQQNIAHTAHYDNPSDSNFAIFMDEECSNDKGTVPASLPRGTSLCMTQGAVGNTGLRSDPLRNFTNPNAAEQGNASRRPMGHMRSEGKFTVVAFSDPRMLNDNGEECSFEEKRCQYMRPQWQSTESDVSKTEKAEAKTVSVEEQEEDMEEDDMHMTVCVGTIINESSQPSPQNEVTAAVPVAVSVMTVPTKEEPLNEANDKDTAATAADINALHNMNNNIAAEVATPAMPRRLDFNSGITPTPNLHNHSPNPASDDFTLTTFFNQPIKLSDKRAMDTPTATLHTRRMMQTTPTVTFHTRAAMNEVLGVFQDSLAPIDGPLDAPFDFPEPSSLDAPTLQLDQHIPQSPDNDDMANDDLPFIQSANDDKFEIFQEKTLNFDNPNVDPMAMNQLPHDDATEDLFPIFADGKTVDFGNTTHDLFTIRENSNSAEKSAKRGLQARGDSPLFDDTQNEEKSEPSPVSSSGIVDPLSENVSAQQNVELIEKYVGRSQQIQDLSHMAPPFDKDEIMKGESDIEFDEISWTITQYLSNQSTTNHSLFFGDDLSLDASNDETERLISIDMPQSIRQYHISQLMKQGWNATYDIGLDYCLTCNLFLFENMSVSLSNATQNNLTLMDAVTKEESLHETVTLFYVTEIIRLISQMHSNGIVHSNLTPQSFLLKNLDSDNISSEWNKDANNGWEYKGLMGSDFSQSVVVSEYPNNTRFQSNCNESITTFQNALHNATNKTSWTFEIDIYYITILIINLLTTSVDKSETILNLSNNGRSMIDTIHEIRGSELKNSEMWCGVFDWLLAMIVKTEIVSVADVSQMWNECRQLCESELLRLEQMQPRLLVLLEDLVNVMFD